MQLAGIRDHQQGAAVPAEVMIGVCGYSDWWRSLDGVSGGWRGNDFQSERTDHHGRPRALSRAASIWSYQCPFIGWDQSKMRRNWLDAPQAVKGRQFYVGLVVAPDKSSYENVRNKGVAISRPDCTNPYRSTLVFRFGQAVGVRGHALHASPVEDDDLPPVRFDKPSISERMQGLRYARSSNSQHQPEELVGKRKRSVFDPVVRHEQPACEALPNRGSGVGYGSVGCLDHERLNVSEQQAVQGLACIHGSLQVLGLDVLSLPGHLNVGGVRGGFGAEHDGGAGHSLATDQAYLDSRIRGLDGNHGRDPGVEKIHIFNAAIGFLQVPSQRESDWRQVPLQEPEIIRR
jgi:hypothetical protein